MTHQWSQPFAAADTPRDEIRQAWIWLLVTGVLAVIAGALAIAVPAAASVTTAIFLGWVLVFASAVMLVHAFSRHTGRETWVRLLHAILTFVVGFYLLVAPLDGTLTLTFVLAAWFFASGIVELVAAVRHRGTPNAGISALNGVLSLVLGLLIAVDLPSSAGWAIGLLVGVYLLFFGARSLVLAAALRRLQT
jgi:uncharacterized membrane protein HdeD (DUF308 family)